MKKYSSKLEVETSHAMLIWMAHWAKMMVNRSESEGKTVYLGYEANKVLRDAASLLVEYGIFEEPNRFEFNLLTTEPQIKKSYKLEDIIFCFFSLGDFYWTGIKFKEEGFKASHSIAPLFENLILLGYCKKDTSFYFWTDKTFNIYREGRSSLCSYIPKQDDYKQKLLNDALGALRPIENPWQKSRAIMTLMKCNVPKCDWKDEDRIEKHIDLWISSWRESPKMWLAGDE